jgi:hypothetical protein
MVIFQKPTFLSSEPMTFRITSEQRHPPTIRNWFIEHVIHLNSVKRSGARQNRQAAATDKAQRRGAQCDTRPFTVNIECLCNWSASRT